MTTSMPVPAPEPFLDLARARELLEGAGLDALVASSPRNVFYLSGLVSLDWLVEPDAVQFAVLPRDEDAPAQVTVPWYGRYSLEDYPLWPPCKVFFGNFYVKNGPPVGGERAADDVEALAVALRAAGVERGRIGLELDKLPVALHRRIAALVPGAEIVDAGGLFRELRTVKTPLEVARIRTATGALERAIRESLSRVRVGMTELELDHWIRTALIEQGAEPVTLSIGAGAGGATVWAYATGRRIEAGDVIRADITASWGSYHADLARTVAVGESTDEQRRHYAAVRAALEAGIAAVSPGGSTDDVFDAAIAVPHALGFADFDRHNFGHGIGLQVHEWPSLARGGGTIPRGGVICVEAPYYVYGLGGFAAEDILVVGADGVERLTSAPDELEIVG